MAPLLLKLSELLWLIDGKTFHTPDKIKEHHMNTISLSSSGTTNFKVMYASISRLSATKIFHIMYIN